MEVTYTLTPEDLWAFQQFHAYRKPLARRVRAFGQVTMALVWLLVLWANARQLLFWRRTFSGLPHFWQLYWSYHSTLLLLLLFYTAFMAYLLWGTRLLFLRRIAAVRAFRETATLHLYPDAVLLLTATQRSRLAWADVSDIAEGPRHLFFYTGPLTAVVVPKRAFPGATAAAFVAAARAFQSVPQAAHSPAPAGDVWPPPPALQSAPRAPGPEDAPDPQGTVEIAYVIRRADAWRSACHALLTHPGTVLVSAVPLLLAAFFVAFFGHLGVVGAGLAFLAAWLAAVLLLLNRYRVYLAARFPARDSAHACVCKIRPDAFVDITPTGRTALPWGDVGAITLVWGDLHLRRKGGLETAFIPRTAFQTPADARAALDAMRRCQRQAPPPPAASSAAR